MIALRLVLFRRMVENGCCTSLEPFRFRLKSLRVFEAMIGMAACTSEGAIVYA
jgi:hypothetical protein